jgi:hypothetical protein
VIRLLGAAALASALALAGCSASSSTAPRSTASSGTGTSQASFRKCLERHGLTLPAFGGAPGNNSTPHPRPRGSAPSSFRKAIQACGGFRGGGFPGGGGIPGGTAPAG